MYPTRQRTLLALILAAQTANAWTAEQSFTVDETNTVPSFEVNHLGFSTQRGHFKQTSGKVVMDEQKKTGKVDITIDANSIDTGIGQLDDVLRKLDFLNVARYPTLSFRSSQFRFSSDQLSGVDGTLTMLGVSRPVSLKVTHYKCGIDVASSKYICDVDAEASFKRSDFGMSSFIPVVSDDVKLKIKVRAARDPLPAASGQADSGFAKSQPPRVPPPGGPMNTAPFMAPLPMGR
jgi:polyisoprenoid-binding protein YceI